MPTTGPATAPGIPATGRVPAVDACGRCETGWVFADEIGDADGLVPCPACGGSAATSRPHAPD